MRGIVGIADFSEDIRDSKEDIVVMQAAAGLSGAEIITNKHYHFAGDRKQLTRIEKGLLLYRDPLGKTPLFYTLKGSKIIFASCIQAILAHPGVEARLELEGLAQLLALGPARCQSSGILAGIKSLAPGHFLQIESGKSEPSPVAYWDFKPDAIHMDSEAETILKVRKLLTSAVLSSLSFNNNCCAMLSGGLDSSLITAIAAEAFRNAGQQLNTFSFDFKDSADHFKSNAFQPERDRPWIDKMVAHCNTRHEHIECSPEELIEAIEPAVDARGLPGMADVDASLLYFCKKISKQANTSLTGECADEIFGGYPWFHQEPGKPDKIFPWAQDYLTRKALLKDQWVEELKLEKLAEKYHNESFPPRFPKDSELRRGYLTLKWFMPTLLERMYCMGRHSGLSAAIPFADIDLMEYVWAIPWETKRKNNKVKYILQEAARGLVPDSLIERKKSPFPKTYDPRYTALLAERLHCIVSDPSSPVLAIIDRKKTIAFAEATLKDPNTSKPWFGQLMAGPQMMAYVLQLDYWLRKFQVRMLF